MNQPAITVSRNVAPDVDQLSTAMPVPNLGHLMVNAFVLHAQEPVLVDAGVVNLRELTLAALGELMDPADLRWIYLTHVDNDHIGCLDELLALAPRAQLVTTFLGFAKLGLKGGLDPNRVRFLNPGQELAVGDRRLLALKPPTFDAPETTMLWDGSNRTLFSSDCFGGLIPEVVESANEVPETVLRDGMVTWLGIDAPWIHTTEVRSLQQALRAVVELQPQTVLSAHLPPARGMVERLGANILQGPAAPPFVGPDQAAFEAMLAAG